jgi:hypothetical protein
MDSNLFDEGGTNVRRTVATERRARPSVSIEFGSRLLLPAGQVVLLVPSLVDALRSQMCCSVHRLGLWFALDSVGSAQSGRCSRTSTALWALGIVFAFRNISM